MKILPAIVIVFMLLMAFMSNGVIAQTPTPEPTVLSPGDIAIIGYNSTYSNNTQDIVILFLTNVNQGTKISFTDFGWNGSSFVRVINGTPVSDDGVYEWTTDKSYPTGSSKLIIHNPDDSGSRFNFKAIGDQIFVFQGNYDSSPNLLFGVNINYTSWQNDVMNSSQSKLPEILENANLTNLLSNSKYDTNLGITFTSTESAMIEITKNENWVGHETNRLVYSTLPEFKISPTIVKLNNFSNKPQNYYPILIIVLIFITMALLRNKNFL